MKVNLKTFRQQFPTLSVFKTIIFNKIQQDYPNANWNQEKFIYNSSKNIYQYCLGNFGDNYAFYYEPTQLDRIRNFFVSELPTLHFRTMNLINNNFQQWVDVTKRGMIENTMTTGNSVNDNASSTSPATGNNPKWDESDKVKEKNQSNSDYSRNFNRNGFTARGAYEFAFQSSEMKNWIETFCRRMRENLYQSSIYANSQIELKTPSQMLLSPYLTPTSITSDNNSLVVNTDITNVLVDLSVNIDGDTIQLNDSQQLSINLNPNDLFMNDDEKLSLVPKPQFELSNNEKTVQLADYNISTGLDLTKTYDLLNSGGESGNKFKLDDEPANDFFTYDEIDGGFKAQPLATSLSAISSVVEITQQTQNDILNGTANWGDDFQDSNLLGYISGVNRPVEVGNGLVKETVDGKQILSAFIEALPPYNIVRGLPDSTAGTVTVNGGLTFDGNSGVLSLTNQPRIDSFNIGRFTGNLTWTNSTKILSGQFTSGVESTVNFYNVGTQGHIEGYLTLKDPSTSNIDGLIRFSGSVVASSNNIIRGGLIGTFTSVTNVETPLLCNFGGFTLSADQNLKKYIIDFDLLLPADLPAGLPNNFNIDQDDVITFYKN